MSKETKVAVRRSPELWPRRIPDVDTLFDRMFGSSWLRPISRMEWPSQALAVDAPAVDLYEEKDDLVLKAEIPGLNKDEIDVTVSGSTLTIKGEKKKEEEIKEKDYYRCERSFGAFSRVIELPVDIKTDGVKATFKNGLLEVRMPKTEEAKNNVVHVKVA